MKSFRDSLDNILLKETYDNVEVTEQIQTQGLPLQPKIQLPDGVRVMVVDGAYLRSKIDVDIIGGGHHYVYNYIPEDEIWLENLAPSEQRFILLHEVVERLIMKVRGWEYLESHATANFVEAMFRHGHKIEEIFPWFIDSYIVQGAPEYKDLGLQLIQAIISYR